MTAGHSWVRTRKKQGKVKTLFYSYWTACSWALTGSAHGKACGQALAGSLGPRGTAWAPSMLQIKKKKDSVWVKTEKHRGKRSALSWTTADIFAWVSTAGLLLSSQHGPCAVHSHRALTSQTQGGEYFPINRNQFLQRYQESNWAVSNQPSNRIPSHSGKYIGVLYGASVKLCFIIMKSVSWIWMRITFLQSNEVNH